MSTTVTVEEALLLEAQTIGSHKTKKETVDAALRAYIQKRARMRLLELEGQLEWDDTYDYKAGRRGLHESE